MIDLKLEVVVIPVSDVDRAKRFYGSLGWRPDADFAFDNGFRVVQFTPPGSACSVQFGAKMTSAAPGSAQGNYLIVSDVQAARDELVARGVKISEVFHAGTPGAQFQPDGTNGRVRGPAPDHATYRSFATFNDPDGNGWLLQEITTRLPGRGLSNSRDSDGASARGREASWRVRTDRSEAPLVGVVRRLPCRTPERQDSRRCSEGCRAPFGRSSPMRADIVPGAVSGLRAFGPPRQAQEGVGVAGSSEQRAARAKGDIASFYPYGKTQAQVLAELD